MTLSLIPFPYMSSLLLTMQLKGRKRRLLFRRNELLAQKEAATLVTFLMQRNAFADPVMLTHATLLLCCC